MEMRLLSQMWPSVRLSEALIGSVTEDQSIPPEPSVSRVQINMNPNWNPILGTREIPILVPVDQLNQFSGLTKLVGIQVPKWRTMPRATAKFAGYIQNKTLLKVGSTYD